MACGKHTVRLDFESTFDVTVTLSEDTAAPPFTATAVARAHVADAPLSITGLTAPTGATEGAAAGARVVFRDGNGFSNFVANPLDVLGWDPHERLADWLQALIAEARP